MSKKIGYIRVSSTEQNPQQKLEGVELDKVLLDKASGKVIGVCFGSLHDPIFPTIQEGL